MHCEVRLALGRKKHSESSAMSLSYRRSPLVDDLGSVIMRVALPSILPSGCGYTPYQLYPKQKVAWVPLWRCPTGPAADCWSSAHAWPGHGDSHYLPNQFFSPGIERCTTKMHHPSSICILHSLSLSPCLLLLLHSRR